MTTPCFVIINSVPHAFRVLLFSGRQSRDNRREANKLRGLRFKRIPKRGQVAQVVERSPEKAGVGGSTPSLATIISKVLASLSILHITGSLPAVGAIAAAQHHPVARVSCG